MNNIDVEEEMKEINGLIGDDIDPIPVEREYRMTNLQTGEETTVLRDDLDSAVNRAREDGLSALFSMKCPHPDKCKEEWHHGVVVSHYREFRDPRIADPTAAILGLLLGGRGDAGDEQ